MSWDPRPAELYLTRTEAMAASGLSEWVFNSRLASGELTVKAVGLGSRSRSLYRLSDVLALRNGRKP